MMKTIVAALVLALSPMIAAAQMTKSSPLSVTETADGLEAAVAAAGATLFARVDHAAGAQSVDQTLPDAQLLIFGNPALGTMAMQDDIRAGLVLPLRVLVYADADGATQLLWTPAEEALAGFDIAPDAEVIQRINTALDNLTTAAVAPD